MAVLTAWTHDSLGLEEEAAEHYEAALANGLAGDDLRGALLGLGSTYRTLGRDDDSERIFRRGLEEFPDFRPYRVFRAMLQYNRGEAREAVRELVNILLETTSDPTSSATSARSRATRTILTGVARRVTAGALGLLLALPLVAACGGGTNEAHVEVDATKACLEHSPGVIATRGARSARSPASEARNSEACRVPGRWKGDAASRRARPVR